ncbi:MAG TPA: hypothetical protein PKZ84_19885 [Anaerolineae bacterium]|nr:hypothetical protein [Anaerolineae bacterium]HQI87400.1 hypothetical protein [Anaerolineae bacterium]
MTTQTFEITEGTHIVVAECRGNLTVESGDEGALIVKTPGPEEEAVIVQEDGALVIETYGNCRLTCPGNVDLTLKAVRGNLKLDGVGGDLIIDTVNGNATLSDIGSLTLQRVYGNLRVENAEENVAVTSVAGNARIKNVAGEVSIGSVGGDLRAEGLAQGLALEGAGADVRLGPPFAPDMEYIVRAGSDLIVHLPEDANVRFELQAGGGVRANIPDLVLHQEGGKTTATLGEGAALIKAQVGGRVVLKVAGMEEDYGGDFDFDFNIDLSFLDALNDLGPMIEARVAQAMAGLEAGLQEGLRHIDGDRIRIHIERAAEKAQQAAERIAEKAQQAAEREAERARRAAEREAERARMRAEHAERRWQRASGYPTPPEPPTPPTAPTPPTPPTPPEAPEAPAHTADELREERLQVLRMVQEGQLTPEDAAKLLAALH